MDSDLASWGWNPDWDQRLYGLKVSPVLKPARVIHQHKKYFTVQSESGDFLCTVSGKFSHHLGKSSGWPVIGDWVLFSQAEGDQAQIQELIPRINQLSRHDERGTEQVLAANIDQIFLVMALDSSFKNSKLIRFYESLQSQNLDTQIVLNKIDLASDPESKKSEIELKIPGVRVSLISCKQNLGTEELKELVSPGQTCLLLGPSGSGKSSLLNILMGTQLQKTGQVREFDQKGRHTTTSKQLFLLSGGGLLIDSPGLRGISEMGTEEDVVEPFSVPDFQAYLGKCRYRNCRHKHEPGCAIKQAVLSGEISESIYNRYISKK